MKAIEILDEFEKKNNPFYPNKMRWQKESLIKLVEYILHSQQIGKDFWFDKFNEKYPDDVKAIHDLNKPKTD